jgi:hypothetical protein
MDHRSWEVTRHGFRNNACGELFARVQHALRTRPSLSTTNHLKPRIVRIYQSVLPIVLKSFGAVNPTWPASTRLSAVLLIPVSSYYYLLSLECLSGHGSTRVSICLSAHGNKLKLRRSLAADTLWSTYEQEEEPSRCFSWKNRRSQSRESSCSETDR